MTWQNIHAQARKARMKAAAAAFAARICLSRTLADWRVKSANLREQADDNTRTAQHHFFKQAAGLMPVAVLGIVLHGPNS